MSFKFYLNKKTRHPSISLKQNDKKRWHNISISHKKPKDAYLVINDPHPKAGKSSNAYAQRYIRKDKKGVRGHPFREYKLNDTSERSIKQYLKQKYKKR